MMASRKPTDGPRRLQRGKKRTNPMVQYALIGGVLAVLLVVVVVLATAKKPAAPSRSRRAEVASPGSARPTRPAGVTAKAARTVRNTKEQRREERRRQREAGRAARTSSDAARTKRVASGGVSRSTTSSPRQLRAIIVDEAGTRYALVGDRRFKPGDDVSGHKILDVGADQIRVSSGANTYSVKVGQPIY